LQNLVQSDSPPRGRCGPQKIHPHAKSLVANQH
jgi:hypothetical protein